MMVTFEKENLGAFVEFNEENNSITFKMQDEPIKEAGVNGCQVDSLILVARNMIVEFNKAIPCRENSIAITKLEEALLWLGAREADRKKRGVEGTSSK